MFNKRRIIIFLMDLCLIAASFLIAFYLRFESQAPTHAREWLVTGLCIVMIVKPVVFLSLGLHNTLWRYASIHDMMRIFKIVTLSSILSSTATILILISRFESYPRSLLLLDWGVLLVLVGASRMALRVYFERHAQLTNKNGRRTLIVGAGDAGNLLLKEIRRIKHTSYNVIGFIDDDRDKQRMRLNGVPVLGQIDRLKSIVRKNKVEEVIFAIPSSPKETMRKVVGCCETVKVRFKTIPSLSDIIDDKISISQIKDVEIEDLLGRDPVVLDENSILQFLHGKKVLISGAAGSIGSEICRQVAKFKPAKMILIDNGETPLYHIEKELAEKHPHLRIIPVLCDIRRMERIAQIFNEFKPEVVFHAAAYKHVPMMEYNPMEAVSNNIKGTKIIADAAHRCGVMNFVMISTDKAVNPTNVMGASKRVAEIYIQALAKKSSTKFTTVRFGNVLGSNGSVIPLFKEQIKRGGPVTVTDPKVIRYFMTIPEACQLVLQAGCIGKGGEIFLLDMGEPVLILDLAKELIRLSGLVPYEDIDIVFTGLRPGEKLFEELLIDGEGIKPTRHEKIRVLAAVDIDFAAISRELEELFRNGESSNITGIIQLLQCLVPEFSPNYCFNEEPPVSFRRVRPDLFPAERSLPSLTV
jgi:FlaA1/EpsC-like NDP-sugar epimerase